MSEEEDILKDRLLEIPESQITEMFQLVYNENLFALLSETNFELGKHLLETKFGMELNNLNTMGLKFTVDDHTKIASEVLGVHEKQSDFWKLVVKISYIMLAIERNPLIAGDIDDLKGMIK